MNNNGRIQIKSPLYRLVPLLLAAVLLETAAAADPAPAVGVHDPHIIKHKDEYFIFATGRRRNLIQTLRSHDLIHWQPAGTVFSALPDWIAEEIPGCRNLWAPDVHFINGRYCVYYSASTFGSQRSLIGLAANQTLDPADPNYAWIDEGKVIESQPGMDFNAIDAGIVTDTDGRLWMTFGSHWKGIYLFELNPKTGKSLHDPPKPKCIARRPGKHAVEAPCIIYRSGFYYLFVSFDQCCRGAESTYNIRLGRAAAITGPYIDADGKHMTEGGGSLILEGGDRFKGPGHNSILFDNEKTVLVYHTYDAQNRGRPILQIRPVHWQDDSWLTLGPPLDSPSSPNPERNEQTP